MAALGEPEIFQKALKLYDEGKFKEGYTLITEHAAEYPDYMQQSFYFRLCLIAKTGDLAMAEEILEDALDQGYFFSEFALVKDEDLQALQGRGFYEKLVLRDLQMLNEAQKNSKPMLQIIHPIHEPHNAPTRFLMALHGNNSNLKRFLPVWEFVSRADWLTAVPQSSQVGGSELFVWNDQAIALREIKTHYQTVLKHYTPDPELSLISGFSMGGNTALRAALEQTFPISAFLLIGPYFGEIDAWIPLIEASANKGLRGYFLLGELDEPITAGAKAMQKLLEDHGIPCGVEVFEGLRHEFPPDFEQVYERVTRTLFPG